MGHPTMQENDTAKLTPTLSVEVDERIGEEVNFFLTET